MEVLATHSNPYQFPSRDLFAKTQIIRELL
jgi:hypothetical protein